MAKARGGYVLEVQGQNFHEAMVSVFWGWKAKIKVSAVLVFPEASLLGL